MKILVADKLSDHAIQQLEALGAEVTANPDLKSEEITSVIHDSEVLIVRSTKVKADVIHAANKLSLIIRAGAGVNTIDLAEASKHAIYVANCPGKNTDAVAELAIGLMIAADRQIVNASSDLRAGSWKKKVYGKARGLKGRTLGIIGTGAIGRGVIRRAKALDMNVIGWSRSLTDETAAELGIERAPTVQDLARQSDVVSVHIAATPQTTHIINADFLAAMKDGAILINTSRGETMDTAAVKRAIGEKGLRVAMDVYEDEPSGGDAPFQDVKLAATVTGTPHIGASTDQSAEAIADEVVHIVESYMHTGLPANSVNIRQPGGKLFTLIVRHYNCVGVLAFVLDSLREAGINIEEMTNTIFDQSAAASCSLQLDDPPDADLLAAIARNESILQVSLK